MWQLLNSNPMSQTLTKIYIHATFHIGVHSQPIPLEKSENLYLYIAGIIKNRNCIPIKINGVGDHIHILIAMPPITCLSKLIQDIKTSSSRWMKTNGVAKFNWQNGYGAFSVSASVVDATSLYIQNQRIHHQKRNYYDELLEFCRLYKVEANMEYMKSE